MNSLRGIFILMVGAAGIFTWCGAYGQPAPEGFVATTPPQWHSEESTDLAPNAPAPEAPAAGTASPAKAPEGTGAAGGAEASTPPVKDDVIQAISAEYDQAADAKQPERSANTPAPVSRFGSLGYFLQVIVGLCAVCCLILVLGYLGRRYGRNTPLLSGQRLGKVIGKVHLTPRASLHYVRSGGRVLVVGLTQQQLTLITEFDAEEFESLMGEPEPAGREPEPAAESFLAQLRATSEGKRKGSEEDDLETLRGDIQRLQRYVQESAREPRD